MPGHWIPFNFTLSESLSAESSSPLSLSGCHGVTRALNLETVSEVIGERRGTLHRINLGTRRSHGLREVWNSASGCRCSISRTWLPFIHRGRRLRCRIGSRPEVHARHDRSTESWSICQRWFFRGFPLVLLRLL